MGESNTPPATAPTKKQKFSQKIVLDQMYMIGRERFGPGEVTVTNEDHFNILEAAVERNSTKLPMGSDDAHERPDGSMTVMHPETRITDTVFQRQAVGDAITESGSPEEEEKQNAERTVDARKAREKKVSARKGNSNVNKKIEPPKKKNDEDDKGGKK